VSGQSFLLYCDDSGDESDSYYSALLIPMDRWAILLSQWLQFRQWLYKKHEVPSRYELHAYKWIPAKGTPPVPSKPDALINTSVGLRREIAQKALKAIASMEGLGVITCHQPGAIKSEAYATLVATVDAELASRGDWALMIGDGSPKNPDPHVQRAHRDLDVKTRRIVEDGWVQDAHASQFIQAADLVAHCAFQAHRQESSRRFMWDWYTTHMHDKEWVCCCPATK